MSVLCTVSRCTFLTRIKLLTSIKRCSDSEYSPASMHLASKATTTVDTLLQVRNLGSCVKVAVDFVLPESLNQAFRFAEEFCTMAKQEGFEKDADGNSVPVAPKDRQHTDKLQAELSMCLAAKHAVDMLQQQQAVKAEGAEGAYLMTCMSCSPRQHTPLCVLKPGVHSMAFPTSCCCKAAVCSRVF